MDVHARFSSGQLSGADALASLVGIVGRDTVLSCELFPAVRPEFECKTQQNRSLSRIGLVPLPLLSPVQTLVQLGAG